MADIPAHVIFGIRMKRMHEARGWSLRELGRRSGVSNPMLSKIEHGGSCTLDIAAKIAGALRTTIDAMLSPWTCGQCIDSPPPGFTCQACGAHGKASHG